MRLILMMSLAIAGACSTVRWSGTDEPVLPVEGPDVSVSTEPARAHPKVDIPYVPKDREERALFPSDLGPEELAVDQYAAQQRYNYQVYAQACSRCHTLARSLNAPAASRAWWRFYILSMRMRARLAQDPLAPAESAAALEFLDYDDHARKSTPEFEALSAELERRYDELAERRLREFLRRYQAREAPKRLLKD